MARSSRVRFGIVWATVVMAGFALGAVLGPPDVFVQAAIGLGVIPFGVLLAYLVVYRTDVFASDSGISD